MFIEEAHINYVTAELICTRQDLKKAAWMFMQVNNFISQYPYLFVDIFEFFSWRISLTGFGLYHEGINIVLRWDASCPSYLLDYRLLMLLHPAIHHHL